MSSDALVISVLRKDALAEGVRAALGAAAGTVELRRFPDDETYVRFETDPKGRDVVLVCDLHHPDAKTVTLALVCEAARDLGARRVGVVAPYMPYMRQDARFKPLEGITSRYYGKLLSSVVDWLVTVDPHLHRHAALSEVVSAPHRVVSAAEQVAAWVKTAVKTPLFIGPDAESAQWAQRVAELAGAPHIVLEKRRKGDHEVELTVPDLERWRGRTPVLVDDIVSTGTTLIETLGHVRRAGLESAVCVVIHALFSAGAWQKLEAARPARLVTCNAVPHLTNAIDLSESIAVAVRELLSP
jgi:ribose-phosphate pyrophosphokinase